MQYLKKKELILGLNSHITIPNSINNAERENIKGQSLKGRKLIRNPVNREITANMRSIAIVNLKKILETLAAGST